MSAPRRLAHLRVIGYGARGWGRSRNGLAGQTRAQSVYDSPSYVKDTGEGGEYRYSNGVETSHVRAPVQELTTTRAARIGSQYDSAANALIWQGTFAANWTGPFAFAENGGEQQGPLSNPIMRPPHTALTNAFNPAALGTKELHRATVYQPYPASGDIYPKVI
jgi:hypothetical protein